MLTARTRMIISAAVSCDTAADIGTDHGFVPIELVKTGVCRRAIACDISPGPLERARENIRRAELSDRIDTRLGAGLAPLEMGEAQLIIIAGMGGDNIMNILKEGEKTARAAARLLLQPMNGQYELRRYLYENGWTLAEEELCCEGAKVYNLLVVDPAGKGQKYARELDFHLPPPLYSHRDFGALAAKEKRRFKKILTGQEKADHPDGETADYCRKILKEIDELCKMLYLHK